MFGQTVEINILDDKDEITDKKSQKRYRYLKVMKTMRSQSIMLEKYGIDVKLLSIMFLHKM